MTILRCSLSGAACTADGNGITYNKSINVALAVAMPDGGLITPVIKDADVTDIYQVMQCPYHFRQQCQCYICGILVGQSRLGRGQKCSCTVALHCSTFPSPPLVYLPGL